MSLRNMEIDDVVVIIPKTKHAKNRVHEHGDICDVVHIKESMFCVKHRDGTNWWRWIDFTNDEHFEFVMKKDWHEHINEQCRTSNK